MAADMLTGELEPRLMTAGEIKCLFSQTRNNLAKPRLAEHTHTSPQGGAVVHIAHLLMRSRGRKTLRVSRRSEGAGMGFQDCWHHSISPNS